MSQDTPDHIRRSAGDRAAAVAEVQDGRAVEDAALEHGVTETTLKRWIARADAAAAAGLVETAGLADHPRSGRPPKIWKDRPGAETAYWHWRKLYMRSEQPTAVGCLRTVERVGTTRGWQLPPAKAFLRRLRSTTSAPEIIRSREGRIAALATYPFQRRTVEGLAPLDIINGDGYRHNVFVLPPGGEGERFRPVTWFWQDVRTRRMLGWRSGPTESSDLVRLSFHDVATTIGVPGKVLQDNTRAASTKWFAGSSLRWRKDREDALSLLKSLGVQPMRTGVDREDNGKAHGHGNAKPVERAFQDLGEEIDKHPRAAGAWTGPNPMEKPANYDPSHAIPWETFEAIVADGVAQHNARPDRRTEAADGRSFDATWEAEIATTAVRRFTRDQEALLLLAAESTVVKPDGIFNLKAGGAVGVPRNDYWAEAMANHAGKRVVVRFDPQQLHGHVEVFDLKGRWLCRAECRLPVGFNDVDAARQHARGRRQYIKALDQAHAAQGKMGDILEEYGIDLPAAAPPKRQHQKLVRMTPAAPGRPDTERRRALQAKLDRGLKRVAERDG